MTTPPVLTAASEPRQLGYLQQLLEHQLALKQLLNQQPEAGKVLADRLQAQLQTAFVNLALPVTVDAVSFQEDVTLQTSSGEQTIVPSQAALRPLSTLFNNQPWGGENFDAPHRLYRYYAKTTYQVEDAAAPSKVRTVNSTIGSKPGFETFIDELIRRPDRFYQQALDSFWQGAFAGDNPLTRKQWLADRLAKALLAQAALRVEDGTLDEACKTLIGQIVSKPSSQARAHLPVEQRPAAFAVGLKGQNNEADIPLTGLFVMTGKTPDADIDASAALGAAALFTPDRGFDSFASLHDLDQALHARLTGAKPDNSLLSNISWKDQARARRQRSDLIFTYTQVHENLFENRVSALLTLQKQDIRHGWRHLPPHEANDQKIHELFNRLAHIGSFLDLRDLLIERSRRYIEANMPAWYQAASVGDQQSLQQLIDTELNANKSLAALMRKAAIPSLAKFARDELHRQLAIDHPGWGIDPDTVQVTITTQLNPASAGGGIGPDHVPHGGDPTARPTRTLSLSLIELALRNSNPWDFSFYKLFSGEQTWMSGTGKGKSGTPIQFDDDYLNALIQKLDVSKGYDHLLQTKLVENGSDLRTAWIEAYRASLATQALAAKLDTDSFLLDREHRGYQWLQKLVGADTPAAGKGVVPHNVVASALIIANSPGTRNGYALNEVLMIGVENPRSVASVILYTPSAPTGRTIKEFIDSSAMQLYLKRQWDTSPEWRRYFMQRLSTPGQAVLTESKVARTVLLSELVISARSRINNPFDHLHTVVIKGSLFDALYQQQVVTLRRNADHESTSNAEVEQQSLWNKFTFGLDLALNLISFLPITSAFNAARSVTRTFLLLRQMGASRSTARALWSITGAKGRPLLLPKLAAVPAFRPAPDLSGLEVAVNPLELDRLRGNLFQSKTSPQQYVAINGKYYLSDVAQRQRYLYPQGTGYRSLRYPMVLDESLKNWQVEPMQRLPGGMDVIEKGPLQTTYRDYELSVADLAALPNVNWTPAGSLNLGSLHPTLANTQTAALLHLFAIQSRMRRHARSFFRTFVAPERPITLARRSMPSEQLLQTLFNQRNGLVFGEHHKVALTRDFLIRHAPVLKAQGVKGLYLEAFSTDLHQALLDQYNASPTAPLPELLRDRLHNLDIEHRTAGPLSYTRLIEAVHAQGIPILALDSTASALLGPRDLLPPGYLTTLSDQLDRVTLFNFFAHKKISADQLALGPHRWIAMVGHGHCNTLQKIPGLAELTNATGIRIESRIATRPTLRVKSDPGVQISSPLGTDTLMMRCDLLACLPTNTNPREIARRVHSPNLFTTINKPNDSVAVYYMNTRRESIEVPVLADGTQAYVNHPAFGAVSERRFSDLDALTDALMDELGMIEV